MPHSRFKRRFGLALAFALVIALMLPVTALGADKQPYQKSERSQTVYCSTSKTTPDGKTVKEDCTPDTNGPGGSSDSSGPTNDPMGTTSPTPDTIDSWLNGLMDGLFWAS